MMAFMTFGDQLMPFSASGTTGVTVFSKLVEGTTVQAAKAFGIVAAPLADVLHVCHITTDKQAVEQDADMLAWRIVTRAFD